MNSKVIIVKANYRKPIQKTIRNLSWLKILMRIKKSRNRRQSRTPSSGSSSASEVSQSHSRSWSRSRSGSRARKYRRSVENRLNKMDDMLSMLHQFMLKQGMKPSKEKDGK